LDVGADSVHVPNPDSGLSPFFGSLFVWCRCSSTIPVALFPFIFMVWLFYHCSVSPIGVLWPLSMIGVSPNSLFSFFLRGCPHRNVAKLSALKFLLIPAEFWFPKGDIYDLLRVLLHNAFHVDFESLLISPFFLSYDFPADSTVMPPSSLPRLMMAGVFPLCCFFLRFKLPGTLY